MLPLPRQPEIGPHLCELSRLDENKEMTMRKLALLLLLASALLLNACSSGGSDSPTDTKPIPRAGSPPMRTVAHCQPRLWRVHRLSWREPARQRRCRQLLQLSLIQYDAAVFNPSGKLGRPLRRSSRLRGHERLRFLHGLPRSRPCRATRRRQAASQPASTARAVIRTAPARRHTRLTAAISSAAIMVPMPRRI